MLSEQELRRDATGLETLQYRRLRRLMENAAGLSCLALGGSGVLHRLLRQGEGRWFSLAWDKQAAQDIAASLEDSVWDVENGRLPFKDGVLDLIVVLGGMEEIHDDYSFIAECHRVLTLHGRLLVTVRLRKPWALLPTPQRSPNVRPGYTEAQLFGILKDGFDVKESLTYGRIFSELASNLELNSTLNSLGLWLDKPLFFTRGYHLMALAKRRPWRPRRAPILSDGRSIAEAALQSKIGTAFEF